MNADYARKLVAIYHQAREEEMISRASKIRNEADKAIESQATVGGHVTFINRPARGVEPHLVRMLTEDGFAVEHTNDGNLRISW